MRGPYELDRVPTGIETVLKTQHYIGAFGVRPMGQAMVAIVQDDCTGCDLCILHCPFEALLPLMEQPEGRLHPKRPIVVEENRCVGCLSCIGSCPTDALHEVLVPPDSIQSPLLQHTPPQPTEAVMRWTKRTTSWP
jgi:ferredoxin